MGLEFGLGLRFRFGFELGLGLGLGLGFGLGLALVLRLEFELGLGLGLRFGLCWGWNLCWIRVGDREMAGPQLLEVTDRRLPLMLALGRKCSC